MGKRLPHTPSSQIKSAFRRCWEYSRERRDAIKLHSNICQRCGTKGRDKDTKHGVKCKIEVHHKYQPDWDKLITLFRAEVLQHPEDYLVLCKECHASEHFKLKEEA